MQNELLHIMLDSNFESESESEQRILKLLKKVKETSENADDFERNIASLKITINALPKAEIELLNRVIKEYREQKWTF